MSMRDNFTIYLPANASGAVSMSENESIKYSSVSSWYKSTLDQTYELDGDGWEVGLLEICFPSQLLSYIEEPFEIGVKIVNPVKTWIKSVRQEYINTFKPGLPASTYDINKEFDKLDAKFENVGIMEYSTKGLNHWSDNTREPATEGEIRRSMAAITEGQGKLRKPVPIERILGLDFPDSHPEASADHVPISTILKQPRGEGIKMPTKGAPAAAPPTPTPIPKSGAPNVTAETATGTHDPLHADDQMWKTLIGDSNIEDLTFYFRRRPLELAIGHNLDIEHDKFPSVSTVKEGFYSTRAELVTIINERLSIIVHNRSYPGEWSNALVEPQLMVKDSGIVSVACGFHDPFNGLTSDFLYLVPTISSEQAIKFLGLDMDNWNKDGDTFVFTVKNQSYRRRDSHMPIEWRSVERTQKVKEGVPKHINFSGSQRQEMIDLCWEFAIGRLKSQFADRNGISLNETQLLLVMKKPIYKRPQFLYVQADIASPVAIGNSRASILRITTFKETRKTASGLLIHNEPEKYVKVFFVPVARRSFNTIEIFLSDEHGSELVFDEGTVFVVLEFRRRTPFSSLT